MQANKPDPVAATKAREAVRYAALLSPNNVVYNLSILKGNAAYKKGKWADAIGKSLV